MRRRIMLTHLGVNAKHFAAAGLATAVWSTTASASVLDLFGYGGRGTALAGAAVSTARGHEAVYYNPAGLAYGEHPGFDFGFQSANFDLELGDEPADAPSAPTVLIGFDVPLPLGGVLEDRLALGMGFLIPQRSVLLADIPRPGEPSFILVENRSQTVSIQAALGVRLSDAVSFGAGFLALAELHGAIDVAPNEARRIGSRVSDELIADYAPVFGLMLRPGGDAAMGLVYHGESRADFDLPITADLGDTFPLPIPVLRIEGTAQFDPRQVTLEVSGRPVGDLLVATGVTWKNWAEFPVPIELTAVRPTDPPQPAPAFHDTFVARVGLELPLTAGEWGFVPRLGYAFEPSPAPEQTGLQNLLDNDRHIAAVGLGFRWSSLRLDLSGQLHHLVSRTHTKAPALLEPFGEPAANPAWPSVETSGRIVALAAVLGVEL